MQDETLGQPNRLDVSAWARGGVAGLGGMFLGVVLSISWQLVLARVLGAAGLGNISLASTLFLVLTTLVPLGLDSSAMRYVSFHHARKELAQTLGIIQFTTLRSLLLALLVTPLVIWQSDWIAVNIFNKPVLTGVLRVLLLGLPFSVLLQVLGSILQGFERIGMSLLAQQILVPVFRLTGVLLLFLVAGSASLTGVAAMIAVASGLGGLILAIVAFRQWRRLSARAPAPYPPTRGLLRYSARAFLNSAVEQAYAASPVFILGILSTSSAIGVFGAAFRAAVILGLVLISLNFIAAPTMSSMFATGNLPGLRSLYTVITRWALTLALPAFLMLMLLAPGIMAVFGPDFRAGTLALRILAASQMLNIATGPCRTLLNVTDLQHLDVNNGVVGLFLGVLVSLLLVPSYGATGAALGAATYLGVVNLLGLAQGYIVLRMQPYTLAFLKPLLSGLVAAGLALALERAVVFTADWIRLAAVAAVVLASYFALLLALRLEPEDRTAWRDLFRQIR